MKKEQLYFNNKSGFSLIEVILTAVVFSLLVVALIGVLSLGEETSIMGGARSQAVFLSEEGLEAVRNIRDESFVNLVDGTYGISKTTSEWDFLGASDTNGIFVRSINISTVDANTKLVTSTISWQQNLHRTGSVVLSTYFSNWKPF